MPRCMGRKAATLPNLQKIWGTGSPSLPPVETDLTPVGFPGRSTGFNDPCELNRFLGGRLATVSGASEFGGAKN
jgi:hypothetical protein